MIGENNIKTLKGGGVGVLLTDTIYGLVGSALNQNSVERIYRLKGRDPKKPMIILISSIDDLKKFNVELRGQDKKLLGEIWPNKVSVILPVPNHKLEYLHRGTNTLAFRLPKSIDLLSIIGEVGPLVAPSANTEGERPAENIKEAKEYFGQSVDFYVDGGEIKSQSSTVIKLSNGKIEVLRVGEIKIPL